MKRLILLVIISSTAVFAQQGRLIPSPLRQIPRWVRNEFSARNFSSVYTITFGRHPAFLKGDFNGDGRRDIAIQVQDKNSGKSGLAIFHTKKPQAVATPVSILGAGKSLGKAGDDFQQMDVWGLLKHADIPRLNDAPRSGDAIRLGRRDSTGGFIFWNGKQYAWSPEKIGKIPK